MKTHVGHSTSICCYRRIELVSILIEQYADHQLVFIESIDAAFF
jgi:hypothetical protein